MTRTDAALLAIVLFSGGCGTTHTSMSGSAGVVGSVTGAVVALCAVDATTLVAATEDTGVVRSVDGGAHWAPWATGIPTHYVSGFALNARGDLFAATIGSGIYRRLRGAAEWTRVDTSAPKNALARVPAITVSTVDQALYAA